MLLLQVFFMKMFIFIISLKKSQFHSFGFFTQLLYLQDKLAE